MNRFVFTALALLAGTAYAENFDVFTFMAPPGMGRESASGVVRYSRVSGSAFCLFELYGAAPASGGVNQVLQTDWKTLVADRFATLARPEIQAGPAKNGWANAVGGASFDYQGKSSVALLSTFAAGGQGASVLMVSNERACLTDFDTFLKGLSLQKPTASASPTSASSGQTGTAVKTSVVTGYKFTSSNFDDGWVATQYTDWVEVRKGNVTVRLHYGIPYTDQTRNLGEKAAEYYWNQLVQRRYPAQLLDVQNLGNSYNSLYVAQSDATDATGKRVHVALALISASGSAYPIEIVAPDQASFQGLFPDDKSVTNMMNYNKFNVAQNDLGGSWEYSSSSGGTRYYPSLGLITYNTPISMGITYTFHANGTYKYAYSGVTGTVASQDTRSGKFTVSPWTVSLTDSTGKKTEYAAYFVAVRGGRILHMQDKKASAMSYDFERK